MHGVELQGSYGLFYLARISTERGSHIKTHTSKGTIVNKRVLNPGRLHMFQDHVSPLG